MTASRYRAFISYSHKDRAWADWLHRALESYTVPKHLVGRHTSAGEVPARLAPVFRDREELASSTSLARQVNEAMEQSANLIVICSPDSARSRWVNEEILGFKRLGRADRVFCLIVAGEPNAAADGSEGEECFAPALRFELGEDGQLGDQPTEPIAADVRPGMDGKTDAKLKLIAGMLGLGLDGLKQREQHRRQRRMTAITALAVLVMAVTSVLAFKAVVAQHAAERRQKQAEDLVDFMLGDLDDKLREVNRLDILESVADKAMEYFASLPAGDVTDQATAERAKALQKIGSIRFDQGHLQPALESFQAAEALNSALAAELPDSSLVQLQLAQSVAYVGLVRWQQGGIVEADRAFTKAHDILERALRRDPDSIDLLAELANQSTNIGRIVRDRGQPRCGGGKVSGGACDQPAPERAAAEQAAVAQRNWLCQQQPGQAGRDPRQAAGSGEVLPDRSVDQAGAERRRSEEQPGPRGTGHRFAVHREDTQPDRRQRKGAWRMRMQLCCCSTSWCASIPVRVLTST